MGESSRPGSRPESHPGGLLLAVLLLGLPLLVRLACLLELRGNPFFRLLLVDARTYHEMAVQIASGTFHPHTPFWQPPLYPFLLGLLYKVAGPHPDLARLLQAVLGSLSCLLLFRMADRLFGRTAAWIAWACGALYAPWILLDLQLLNAGPAVFLLLLSLYLLLRAVSLSRLLLAGLVLGLAGITVATLLITGPVAAAWLWWKGPRLRRAPASPMLAPLIFLAGIALPVGVVTGANLLFSGQAVVVSYNGGVNFWIGNNPEYSHTVAIRPGREWKALVNEPLRVAGANEAQSSSYFFHKSWDWIRRDPAGYLRLLLYKTRLLLRGDEIARNEEIYPFRRDSAVLRLLLWIHGLAFPFGLLLPLAGAGIVSVVVGGGGKERGPEPLLLASMLFALGLAVVAFFVTSRYRLPLVPFLILFAAAGISSWREAWSLRRRSLLLPGTAFALLLAAGAAGVPPMASDFNSDAHSDLATRYYEQGRVEDAAGEYETALRLDPNNMEAANNLGAIRLKEQRLDEAEALFKRVLDAYPEDPKALLNLGTIWYYKGEPYRAGGYYLRVYKSDPGFPSAADNLQGIERAAMQLETRKLEEEPEAFLAGLERSFLQDPDNEFLFKRLEDLLEARGLYARALRVVEARRKADPGDKELEGREERLRDLGGPG